MRLLGRDSTEPNPVNKEGLTPLAGAVRCGYVGTVKALLGCSGVDLKLLDRDGCSLHSLVGEGGCEDGYWVPVERTLIRIP